MHFEKFSQPLTPTTGASIHRSGPTEPSFVRLGAELPAGQPAKAACRVVRQMVSELMLLLADRVMLRRDRRRYACHVRQISMYVCHVALGIPQAEIGQAFGRDRTTVGHACHVVEDRRDDAAFDDLVSALERMVSAVFGLSEVPAYE